MRLVTAVVKPFKLDDVKTALKSAGVLGMTVSEAQGVGRSSDHSTADRAGAGGGAAKVKIEVLVGAEEVERVARLIADSARTGNLGDGKIWVTEVGRVIRIRTGEVDREAL